MKKTNLAMSVLLTTLLVSIPTRGNYMESTPLPVEQSLSSQKVIRQPAVKINDIKDTPFLNMTPAPKQESISRGMSVNVPEFTVSEDYDVFRLTAYNLSESDCGKSQYNGDYGKTASGYNLSNEDITDRKIAVDPHVINLGEQVIMEFPNDCRYIKLADGSTFDLNGMYTAVDTGGAIKHNRIDLFVGGTDRFTRKLTDDIGVRKVKVRRIRRR